MQNGIAFKGDHPIQFGTIVRNRVTGDQGVVTAKFYLLSGCVTVYYTSQTLRDQNNKPIKHYDAVGMLEVVGEQPLFGAQPLEESRFRLGEKVECPAYGVTGVVTGLGFYPDNAPHVEVQPAYNTKEGRLPDVLSIAASQVVSLERAAKKPTEAERKSSPPREASQGPMTSRRP